MKIDVCFSPALYPVYHNQEAIVVVVDVFRATTTMAAAFKNGVRRRWRKLRNIRQKAGWSVPNVM